MTTSTIFGSGFGNASDQGTAVLLFGAKNVTLSQDTITGAGTDIGVAVSTDTFDTPNVPSTGIVLSHNQIGRTAPDTPDSLGDGINVDPSAATLICNTFSGWKTNIVGAVQIFCPTLPNGTVGKSYPSTALAATGGTPPYHWTIPSVGKLPPGLTLSTSGVITGTPTTAGPFTFTVEVVDSSDPLSTTQPMTITIDPAPATTTTTTTTTAPKTTTPSAPTAPITPSTVHVTG